MPSAEPSDRGDATGAGTAVLRTGRSPQVADLLLLVAALGVGLTGYRHLDREMGELIMDRGDLTNLFALAAPPAMAATLALLASRLLRPRPRIAEVFRQPGAAACWAAALIMAANLTRIVAFDPARLVDWKRHTYLYFGYFWPTSAECGGGVLVAWSTLAIAGCWHPEPSWIDRAGRALGAAWLAAFAYARLTWAL